MKDSGLKLAYAAAVANAAIIGLSFLFTKVALEHAHPLDTLTYRFIVSFAVLSIPVLMGKIRLAKLRGKTLVQIVLLAAMYPVGFFLLQAFGLLDATSAEGGILHAFTPALTLLLAMIFLREVTTLVQKGFILLSVGGVVFILLMTGNTIDFTNMRGILLLLLSCLAIAGYSVLARSLLRNQRPLEMTYILLGIGCVSFLTASVLHHAVHGTWQQFAAPLAHGTFIVSIAYLGVMASLVTALTANYSLSKLSSRVGALFLGEEVHDYHVLGSILIIAGVVGANYRRGGTKHVNPSRKRMQQRHP